MQFDLAGTLEVPDGRYLAREAGPAAEPEADREGAADPSQRVLVVETLGAPPPPRRRRRRAREADPDASPGPLSLARVTAVRAHEPFEDAEGAAAWLARQAADEEAVDRLVDDAVGLLNRALHAQAVAGAEPRGGELRAERAHAVRIGYGSGDEVAAGRYSEARLVDVRGGHPSRRRRDEELRPQERLAAVLGGREAIDACETLLLRARADLDAGRTREAALQLRIGLEALLVELDGALADPGHTEDMATLQARRSEAGTGANTALHGDLDAEAQQHVTELLEICERVLRRRRVLRG